MKSLLPLAALMAACLPAAPSWAGSPHQHGIARLDIAVEPARLVVVLEMPLDSAVGFEREPRTDDERQRLDAAVMTLRDGAAMLRIDPRAGCSAADADVQTRFDAAHADVDVSWTFDCSAADKAGFVEVGLFDAFPRLKRLSVQTATPRGQMKASLARGSSRLPLAR